VCVNEHHANAYGLMPSPNLMAAALTRRTSRAALVVLGNSIALYNPVPPKTWVLPELKLANDIR
jgi:alkanesulfonate monooxygenase SsuD/methylene tetrahydromethanopterin reductase-like flavin-dependent oxidoreductase (luciferase family)